MGTMWTEKVTMVSRCQPGRDISLSVDRAAQSNMTPYRSDREKGEHEK